MLRLPSFTCAARLLLLAWLVGTHVGAGGAEFAPGHVLVKFNDAARARFDGQTRVSALAQLPTALGLPAGARVRENGFVRSMRSMGKRRPAEDAQFDFGQFAYLDLPPGWSVAQGLARLAGHPLLEYAEADGIGEGGATLPNDISFSSQWHHRNLTTPGADIRSTLVWDTTTGSTNVLLAVLDTGLNLTSLEFTNRTMAGYDFVNDDNDPSDDNGHGTAVTGVAAATGNNASRIAGMDWKCRIMPVKVLDSGNSGLYSHWAAGIDFAVTNGAKVINLSAGGSTTNLTLALAILNAINSGAVFVTITHNDGANVIRFPGQLTDSITVGSTTSTDTRATTSNYGPEIDLVAPGQSIVTIGLSGTVQTWSGTSFAAPMVSGAACLLAAQNPALRQDDVRALLCAGADDGVGGAGDTEGFDEEYGWGRLNLLSSLTLQQTSVTNVTRLGNALRLTWASPTNAASKLPYEVEFTDTPAGPWQPVIDSVNFTHTTNTTRWLDDGTETGTPPGPEPTRLYRVRLKF